MRRLLRHLGAAAAPVALVVLALRPLPVAAQVVPPLFAATASADLVLRRADFIVLEHLSLEDLLREQAGIVIGRRGGVGSPELVSIAGSTNGRVQLVLDGVEIAEPELEWPRLYAVQLAMVDSVAIWRTTDPARIAVWTRLDDSTAPVADFDLGRGGLVTRTRRVQVLTPPRAVTVGVAYDELLRSGDDFRVQPTIDTAPDFGAYDNRSLLVRIQLRRGDDLLRVEHQELQDNAHGSFASQQDLDARRSGRNALRWERPLGGVGMALDIGHQAWDHDRRLQGAVQHVEEARTNAALDLAMAPHGAWTGALRLRQIATTGERFADPDTTRADFSRQDLQLEAAHAGRLRTAVSGGVHHLEDADLEWSAAARAGIAHGTWEIGARAGRGVGFAGWGEADPGAPRAGADAAVEFARRDARREVRLTAFVKSLEGGASAHGLFPAVVDGPSRVGGLLGAFERRGQSGHWTGLASTSLAWFPEIRGDPAGLPEFQARVDLRASKTTRGGDLVIEVLTTWRLDTRRRFATGPSIAPSALGDATLDLLVLQRADFFVGFRNLTDAAVETYPGVFLPSRLLWFGVRVRFFD